MRRGWILLTAILLAGVVPACGGGSGLSERDRAKAAVDISNALQPMARVNELMGYGVTDPSEFSASDLRDFAGMFRTATDTLDSYTFPDEIQDKVDDLVDSLRAMTDAIRELVGPGPTASDLSVAQRHLVAAQSRLERAKVALDKVLRIDDLIDKYGPPTSAP